MRLISLRLQNFRQHAESYIAFERGLTGIIGPNGAGKSTILEAIAWALYGNPAARGTRDSIRFARAKERSPVRVELEFELAGHRYRVLRGLTSAECFQDDGEAPIANTITGVTELLQRRLGMTRAEFFHTYFTGQKELEVMTRLGPTERGRFLSRVLGYDRITEAQELIRQRKRALTAEVSGLEQGMPDLTQLVEQVEMLTAQLATTQQRATDAEQQRKQAQSALKSISPKWTAAQAERERAQQVAGERKAAEREVEAHQRDVERIDRELATIAGARAELEPLAALLQPLSQRREALAQMDALAASEAQRQALLERERGLVDELARLDERLSRLATAPQLEQETSAQLHEAREKATEAERTLDEQRTAWARDRQEAETRLEALRTQYADLARQRDLLDGLGEDGPCPTCGRPLGESWQSVLDLLSEQLETVRIDGNYYRARVEQLSRVPESVETLDAQRRTLQQEIAAYEKKFARIQAALNELTTLTEQRSQAHHRLDETRAQLAVLQAGYDAERHVALRNEVAQLGEIERKADRLRTLLEREPLANVERLNAVSAREASRNKLVSLDAEQARVGMGDTEYAALRDAFNRASSAGQRAEIEWVAASSALERARADLTAAQKRQREAEQLRRKLDALEDDRRLHDELDRAFGDLRTDLNFQLRPELSEVASGFLEALTDGRYSSLELDDEYNVQVIEDGLPKQVISGGEEDLCNLVLRVAISQMIAERAGQQFSLLILDEVFGSLDDARRTNVVELLRRLNDRFEQVIVITHIEQVRDGLDRVLLVRYDEETGASSITTASVTASGDDETLESDSPTVVQESLLAGLT